MPIPRKPNRKDSLWQRVRDFFAKPPTTGSTVIIGVLAIFAAGLLAAVASLLIEPLNSATREIRSIDFIAVGVSLTVGLLIAWFGTRQYYRLRMHTSKLELSAIRKEVVRLCQARKTLTRVEIYADHLHNLLEAFVRGTLSLHDPSAPDFNRLICEASERYLSDATHCCFVLTVWGEILGDDDKPAEGRRPGVKSTASEEISQVIEVEPTHIAPKFKLLAGNGLQKKEEEAFAVRIVSSWLKHHQQGEDDHNDEKPSRNGSPPPSEIRDESDRTPYRSKDLERFVYSADFPYYKLSEGDIQAWKKYGYRSVRAISFRRDKMICYLVALSKDDHAFTEAEELYLLWIKRVLELDLVMRADESSQPARYPTASPRDSDIDPPIST
jgi:hypothetical protein